MENITLRHESDQKQQELLEHIFSNTNLSVFELFQNFPVFTPRCNLARFLVHYELFKMISMLPGSIIDLGVFRGCSTFTWAKLCEIFCPTDIRKKVYGFDSFEGFLEITQIDGGINERTDVKRGGCFGGEFVEQTLLFAQDALNCDKHIKNIDRIEFIKGDVIQTIPKFVKEKGNGLRISLLNLDVDLYEPTKIALEQFVPLMVKGGVIIFDEYAVYTYGGESYAIDEYFDDVFGCKPNIQKFPWHSNPSGYIIVDW